MLLLPATMFHLLLVARSGPARLLGPPPYLPGPEALWSPRALLLWLTWLGLQVALYFLPARKVCTPLAGEVGGRRGSARRKTPTTLIRAPLCPQVAEGQELKDKSRLRYPINGAWFFALELHGWGGAPRLVGFAPDHEPHLVFLPPRTDLGDLTFLHVPCPSTATCSICCYSVPEQWLG